MPAPYSVFKQAANSVVGSHATLNPKQQVQPNFSCLACSCYGVIVEKWKTTNSMWKQHDAVDLFVSGQTL